MDLDKLDAEIDDEFNFLIQQNNCIDNSRHFKEVVDVFLCKHKIPYSCESTGSGIKYRCPFSKSCSFCIKGAICRSRSISKKGKLSIRNICLNHTCNWKEIPKDRRTTTYRPSYKNRVTSHKSNEKQDTEHEDIISSEHSPVVSLDDHVLLTQPENPALPPNLSVVSFPPSSSLLVVSDLKNTPSFKQSGSTLHERRSKRPMYCRNAYMHYLVHKIIEYNPYCSLRNLMTILESKDVECKEVTVSKARCDERSRYLTTMKDIILKFREMQKQVENCNSADTFIVSTMNLNNKEILSHVFVCLDDSKRIFALSQKLLVVDCSILKNESGGVIFYASTIDGNHKPILLAFMICEEENQKTWFQFIQYLYSQHISTCLNSELQIIQNLCSMLETCLPQLARRENEIMIPSQSWYLNGNIRKNKGNTKNDGSTLRALFFRSVFCGSSQASNYISRLSHLVPEFVNELNLHGRWSRYLYDRQYLSTIDFITNDFEFLLDETSIRYLNLDDVVMGLICTIINKSNQRSILYKAEMPDSLTLYYRQLIDTYQLKSSHFIIESTQNDNYIVLEQSDLNCVHYTININKKMCSCQQWKKGMFPCIHAWYVCQQTKIPFNEICDDYYKIKYAMTMCFHHEKPEFEHELEHQIELYRRSLRTDEYTIANDNKWKEKSALHYEGSPNSIHEDSQIIHL